MRVKCNRCGSPATIQSSSEESDSVKKLYCCCRNPECGHTFVMVLSFSHTLSPSILDFPKDVAMQIQGSSPLEQKQIFKKLKSA